MREPARAGRSSARDSPGDRRRVAHRAQGTSGRRKSTATLTRAPPRQDRAGLRDCLPSQTAGASPRPRRLALARPRAGPEVRFSPAEGHRGKITRTALARTDPAGAGRGAIAPEPRDDRMARERDPGSPPRSARRASKKKTPVARACLYREDGWFSARTRSTPPFRRSARFCRDDRRLRPAARFAAPSTARIMPLPRLQTVMRFSRPHLRRGRESRAREAGHERARAGRRDRRARPRSCRGC